MAPVPGLGLQEVACSARQAEVLLGSGSKPEELPRSRGLAVLGANTLATALGAGSLGHRGSLFSFSAARMTFLQLESPAQCERPRGSTP